MSIFFFLGVSIKSRECKLIFNVDILVRINYFFCYCRIDLMWLEGFFRERWRIVGFLLVFVVGSFGI